MITVESKNLSKSFGTQLSLVDLSLKFEPKKIHAIVGENGAGKSTLMKILFGLLEPTSGQVVIDNRPIDMRSSRDAIKAGIGMVQQHFCLVENLSALDNIILGNEPMSGFRVDREKALRDLIHKLPDETLHVPWHEKVSDLSVGFRQRIEILKLIYRDSNFLILDEPTAVLTPQEIASFFTMLRTLRDMGRTIVLITHKLGEVFSVCDQYHVLRHGKLMGSGNVADTTQAEIVKLMIGRELGALHKTEIPPLEESALEFSDVTTSVLKNVSLKISSGEILGIAGVEGSGQSHLVDALLGLIRYEGHIRLLGQDLTPDMPTDEIRKMGVGLVPEDRLSQAIWLEESCAKNLIIGIEDQFCSGVFFDEEKIRETSHLWIQDFDVRLGDMNQGISSLSGGNQQKLVFAREILGRKPKFMICHQPTRGVDLGAIEKIHSEILRLKQLGISCLLISSELEELMALSDRICVLFDGKITGEFTDGHFSKAEVGKAMTGSTQ